MNYITRTPNMIRSILFFLSIFITLSSYAHYPANMIEIISRSKLIVCGEVMHSNVDFFEFQVDTVVRGSLSNDVINVKYKKDRQILPEYGIGDYPKYKDYHIGQKLFLFLTYGVKDRDTFWVSTGNYAEGEMDLRNDSVLFPSYHSIDKCLKSDLIESLSFFMLSFKIIPEESDRELMVQQLVCSSNIEFCSLDFFRSLLTILSGSNAQNTFHKNQKWILESFPKRFVPYNGRFHLIHKNFPFSIRGNYKNGK